MEQRFKNYEQKKPKIYRFFNEPTIKEKKLRVIELYKQNIPNEYIAAEVAMSHTTVLKTIRSYRDHNLQHGDMRHLQNG